jgi:hypothetical protein
MSGVSIFPTITGGPYSAEGSVLTAGLDNVRAPFVTTPLAATNENTKNKAAAANATNCTEPISFLIYNLQNPRK